MTDWTDEQIEALCQAATPGPWTVDARSWGVGNAEFIAAARELVPALYARAREAEAERDEALDKVSAIDGGFDVYRRQMDRQESRLRAELAEAKAEADKLRAGSILANEMMWRIHDALGLPWSPADDAHSAPWADSEETIRGVERLAAQVAAVRALHRPHDAPDEVFYAHCPECPADDDGDRQCVGHMVICCSHCGQGTDPAYGDLFACPVTYPCPTIRALDGTEQDEAKRGPKVIARRDAKGSTHAADCPCPTCARPTEGDEQ